ncbi:hypothetical protein AUL39_06955 [Tractidigestivibacter scatoligenes]|uniref:Uncharacterized protein n=1 Tax=Tractidigestivibacter scatoligenes TaxID=1299998 RepID=A0A100YVZ4_TRASO|nr:hypothetical protein [Tractidigestivibacter scatoligenes]KUH58698.1 hypothetical protein AUL39_06955 [Tractidigestivibacter scatoligenes]
MSGEIIDFEGLAMDADVRTACEFVRANVSRQLGTDGDGAADVIAALYAEGSTDAADTLRRAQAEPLDLTLRDLTGLALMVGKIPVLSLPDCPPPATNPEMARVMREWSGVCE